MITDSLGDRMKGYENVSRHFLIKHMPVIMRLDGKAFHTYTKECDSPYDEELHNIREETLKYLCENIQGCVAGYSQSDEISLVLKDWNTLKTCAWFDNNLQKLCSVTSSMCTAKWNSLSSSYTKFDGKLAMFDCRVWNLPKEEVLNYLLWRQRDWERNSIQMLGQSLYSHKQLQGISNTELVSKIEHEFGIIWGNFESWMKRGEVYLYNGVEKETSRFGDIRKDFDSFLNSEFFIN